MKRIIAFLLLSGVAQADPCHVGAYRLDDGRILDLAPTADAALRWRLLDGTSGKLALAPDGRWTNTLGWTDRADAHAFAAGDCATGEIAFGGITGRRVPLATTDVQFVSGDARLAGRLVMPAGTSRVPIVVLVHGSEQSSGRESFALQRQFPAAGIGAFVFDKRGTGGSTGTYTHDYPQLAADVAAAVREARRLAGRRAGRVGLHGGSQGGWVAPLAATLTPVDFVIVAYGLAVSPIEEDREAVALDMARHGFGADETRRALEVARAVQGIIESHFASGYDELERLRARYSGEPWFRYLRGNVTGLLLAQPEGFWREQGPVLLAGVIPEYDPMPVLRKLQTPQLWILGSDDIDAPPAETWRRLLALRRGGRPLSLAMLAGAEHGLYLFELKGEERVSTRLPASYFPLMRDFIVDGAIGVSYPDAVVVR
ncbi:MAG TPA: alpha/beta hydrolase [Steroidobacteraceae bacterium]|nr:alpha/beta hydrolase [Steroidobacteraceae bacterium]